MWDYFKQRYLSVIPSDKSFFLANQQFHAKNAKFQRKTNFSQVSRGQIFTVLRFFTYLVYWNIQVITFASIINQIKMTLISVHQIPSHNISNIQIQDRTLKLLQSCIQQKQITMSKFPIIVLLFSLLISLFRSTQTLCTPLWPRLEFGKVFSNSVSEQKLVIKFNTRSDCGKSYVVISHENGETSRVHCQNRSLELSQNMDNYRIYIQRCSISSQIAFQSSFSYAVYGEGQSSDQQQNEQKAIGYDNNRPIQTSIIDPDNTSKTVNFVVLADWGQMHQNLNKYSSITQTLDQIIQQKQIHGILLNGDIAYELDSNKGQNYEQFLGLLSQAAKYVPVFINTGNHQHHSEDNLRIFYFSFEQYGKQEKLAVALNLGPFYLFGFDPYHRLYHLNTTKNNLRTQDQAGHQQDPRIDTSYENLAQLIRSRKSTEPNKQMVGSSHYPLMCSGIGDINCENDTTYLKDFFDLMFENQIKFYLGAHYHTYERIYPYCSNGSVLKMESPYHLDNEECIVSVVQAVAGNDHEIVQNYEEIKEFTASLIFGKTGLGVMSVSLQQIKYQHYSSDHILTLQDELLIQFEGSNPIVNLTPEGKDILPPKTLSIDVDNQVINHQASTETGTQVKQVIIVDEAVNIDIQEKEDHPMQPTSPPSVTGQKVVIETTTKQEQLSEQQRPEYWGEQEDGLIQPQKQAQEQRSIGIGSQAQTQAPTQTSPPLPVPQAPKQNHQLQIGDNQLQPTLAVDQPIILTVQPEKQAEQIGHIDEFGQVQEGLSLMVPTVQGVSVPTDNQTQSSQIKRATLQKPKQLSPKQPIKIGQGPKGQQIVNKGRK